MTQDLWQTHYQILLLISLKEFIKSNVNKKHGDEKWETCRIKYIDCDFLSPLSANMIMRIQQLGQYQCALCGVNPFMHNVVK